MRIVPIAAAPEPMLAPDIVWDGVMGDYAIAGTDEVGNAGGLRAKAGLATAVTVALMTDVAADPSELRDGDAQRGWPGDSISIDGDARPLGSRLWLLRRRAIDAVETPRLAEDYARAALQGLIDDGAVAAFEIAATAEPAERRVTLTVVGTDRDGERVVDAQYAVLWEEVRQSAVGSRQ